MRFLDIGVILCVHVGIDKYIYVFRMVYLQGCSQGAGGSDEPPF